MPTYDATIVMEDDFNRKYRTSLNISAADVGAAETVLAAQAVLMSNVTELEVLWTTLSIKTVITDTVTAGANKDEGATFSVRKANNERSPVRIPGPIQAMRLGDGTIDLTNTDVIAYFAPYLNGDILVSDGELVTEVKSGKLDV